MYKGQKQAVLDYIKEHGEINRADAIIEKHIFNLTARVSELRADGWNLPVREVETAHGSKYANYGFSALDAERYENMTAKVVKVKVRRASANA